MPPHRAQALLRDALLQVPIEAFPRQVAQPVRADTLLAARAERHHVGLAHALAGVLVERPRHLRAHLRHHLPVRVEEPGEDGLRVAVQERVVDAEDRGGALERWHYLTSRDKTVPSIGRSSSTAAEVTCG